MKIDINTIKTYLELKYKLQAPLTIISIDYTIIPPNQKSIELLYDRPKIYFIDNKDQNEYSISLDNINNITNFVRLKKLKKLESL